MEQCAGTVKKLSSNWAATRKVNSVIREVSQPTLARKLNDHWPDAADVAAARPNSVSLAILMASASLLKR